MKKLLIILSMFTFNVSAREMLVEIDIFNPSTTLYSGEKPRNHIDYNLKLYKYERYYNDGLSFVLQDKHTSFPIKKDGSGHKRGFVSPGENEIRMLDFMIGPNITFKESDSFYFVLSFLGGFHYEGVRIDIDEVKASYNNGGFKGGLGSALMVPGVLFVANAYAKHYAGDKEPVFTRQTQSLKQSMRLMLW